MMDLGYTYGDSMVDTPSEDKKHYPEICIRGEDLPKLPDGEFYAVIKGRVSGMRKPADGEKSIDVEILKMSGPCDEKAAKNMVDSSYDEGEEEEVEMTFSTETSKKALRESLKKVLEENSIGQGN